GEVTVEGEFVGRLEGFRFSQDKSATADEAKTLRSASLAALAPEFHLRADRFYNAPDTELDFTDQGGLMWGEHAVGKLQAGSEPLKPTVKAFVDDEAGPDVLQKVQRRLQHFIDRKVAAAFEPLLAMSKDEELSALARGFAFQLLENHGIIPRDKVATEVKALDQDTRGQLRKHGVRFGQFTIFLPLLLKPAPTRLRLVLWGLSEGLDEFQEAPPPGLVTVPTPTDVPDGYHAMAGYRPAGTRAIRIDMLERLADMLRAQDTRGGFEATPDMLSITGMTLEQFADLMQGLGYRAERGEREKVKAAPPEASAPAEGSSDADVAKPADAETAEAPEVAPAETVHEASETTVEDVNVPETETVEAPVAEEPTEVVGAEAPTTEAQTEAVSAEAPPDQEQAESTEDEGPTIEVFYTFAWAPRRRPSDNRTGGKPRGRSQDGGKPQRSKGSGKPQGKPGHKHGGKRPPKDQGAKTYSAKPARKEKPIDPDNPFAAALMGLKDKT
ncbi:MAG: disulfide oxidoreductase, partial [Pseudomonadota bacterium]